MLAREIDLKRMMEMPPTRPQVGVEEYLAFEALSDAKHEYAAGSVTAMAGATETHESIAMNLALVFGNHLKGHSCRVFKSDLKLRIQLVGNAYFYYPDLMVVCDPEDNESPLYKDRPLVLVEVTSPSSEERDREAKLFAYLSIPSLRSYLIVSHDKREITHYRRTDDGWVPFHHPAAGEVIELPELGLTLTLEDIYDRTSVPA
jgi:Uma2 family endonuclease